MAGCPKSNNEINQLHTKNTQNIEIQSKVERMWCRLQSEYAIAIREKKTNIAVLQNYYRLYKLS